MSRNVFTLKKRSAIDNEKLDEWFEANDFKHIDFVNGKLEILVDSGLESFYHNILENPGYTTYLKHGYAGSILIFEIKSRGVYLDCECYCPIMLFGFFRIELSFKEKTTWLTKYLKEGYNYLEKLKLFVSTGV